MQYRRSVALLALALLTACAAPTAPLDQLSSARARWVRAGVVSYTMELYRGCECLPGASGTVTIVVRNGVVVSRTYANSDLPVPAALASAFPTIEQIFARMETELREVPHPHDLEFDRQFGFPIRYALGDPAADALLYRISAFTKE